MGAKKHKEKDREHRRKHKHRSRSKEKHRSKRTREEKEERRARKRAAKAYAENGRDEDPTQVTEIDYGHGYQQYQEPEPGEIDYEFTQRAYDNFDRGNIADIKAEQDDSRKSDFLADDVTVQTSDNSLSISETNKLRAKLGLKPLETGIPGVSDAGKDGQEDVHAPAVNISEVKRTERIKEKTESTRHKRIYEDKLSKIKGLGESDSEEDDAFAWVKKSRIKQKERELAAKREKILDEMDEEFGLSDLVQEEFSKDKKLPSYTDKDLRGMTVQHTLDRFKEGTSIVMTLDDKGILDEGDDVLVNINMMDDERLDKNLDNKKKGSSYKPYDNADEDGFGMMKPTSMLSKYDEEIDGIKKDGFQLGSKGRYDGGHEKAMSRIREELNDRKQTLTLTAPQLASEYFTASEMETKFRKTKKMRWKVRTKTVVKADDLLAQGDKDLNENYGSRSRGRGINTEALEEIPGLDAPQQYEPETPIQAAFVSGGGEDWAGQEAWPKQETVADRLMTVDDIKNENDSSDSDSGPLEDLTGVIVDPDDAEAELQAALDKTRRLKQNKFREKSDKKIYEHIIRTRRTIKEEPEDDDYGDKKNSIVLNSISEFCKSLGDIPTYGQSGNREDDEDLLDMETEGGDTKLTEEEMIGGWNEVDIDTKPVNIAEDDDNILNDEPIVNKGISTALSLAVQKGYLEKEGLRSFSAQQKSKIEVENYSIEDKRYDDLDEKTNKREQYRYMGALSDFKDKTNYKPDIKLEYMDDKGNMLNNKEAFRYLSHRFHGKGSGKKKTEKRGKKADEDLMYKLMSSIDTPLGTLNLLKEKQKSEKSAYVILTGVSSNKAFMANTITK